MAESKKSVFAVLNDIDCSNHTEQKNGLTYLSWAWAWGIVKEHYPDASFVIYKDEAARPFIEDADFGLMCYTSVTIEGQTHDMWLPVMDGNNAAMRRTPYTIKTRNGEKVIAAATMFDINKTIMRCLVKNLAMFGLGLYIYAGEDLPEAVKEEKAAEAAAKAKEEEVKLAGLLGSIASAKTDAEVIKLWTDNKDMQGNQSFYNAVKNRRHELQEKGGAA